MRGGMGVGEGEARVFFLEGDVVVLEERVLFEEKGVTRLHRHKRLFQIRLPQKEIPGLSGCGGSSGARVGGAGGVGPRQGSEKEMLAGCGMEGDSTGKGGHT